MRKKNRVLLMFLGVKWCLMLIFLYQILHQILNGFSFNWSMFGLFLIVLMWTIWKFQFDFEARRKLEEVNLKFHNLGRKGRREFMRGKGVKSYAGSKIRKYK